jgi:TfoX/Sxy family transcriptional regulator of competence genes
MSPKQIPKKLGKKLRAIRDYKGWSMDQMADAGSISQKKMFGEHAVYCNGKVVALICNNQLFVRPTEKGRTYIENVVEAAPYPRARAHFLIEDAFEDRVWISGLIKLTVQELPPPKQKRKKTIGANK